MLSQRLNLINCNRKHVEQLLLWVKKHENLPNQVNTNLPYYSGICDILENADENMIDCILFDRDKFDVIANNGYVYIKVISKKTFDLQHIKKHLEKYQEMIPKTRPVKICFYFSRLKNISSEQCHQLGIDHIIYEKENIAEFLRKTQYIPEVIHIDAYAFPSFISEGDEKQRQQSLEIIKGKKVIMLESDVKHVISTIVEHFGGPKEKKNFQNLISDIETIPNLPNHRNFITITSNKKFFNKYRFHYPIMLNPTTYLVNQ